MTFAEYEHSRDWSDAYTEAAITICGRHLLRLSDRIGDVTEACDVVTLNVEPLTLALRIRDGRYAAAHPYDVTLRSSRDSGVVTELQKIEAGFCDWFFYGFAGPCEGDIARWFLIDCQALRRFWQAHPNWRSSQWFREITNKDGTYFRAFDLRRLPPSVVIASSHPIPREAEL